MKRKLSLLSTVVLAMTALVVALTPGAASAATPTDGHTYWIVNAKSDKCLDQSWSGGHSNPDILAYVCSENSTNQRWRAYDAGLSYFSFTNQKSAQCLNQDYSGGTPHRDVIAYACRDFDNEYWSVRWDAAAGAYALVNNLSGQCLNQDWSSGVQHQDVIAYTCGATSTNDRWVFVQKS